MLMPRMRSDPYKPKNDVWFRFRVIVTSALNRHPWIGKPMLQGWRTLKLFFLRVKWQIIALNGTLTGTHDRYLNIDKVHWVSPSQISYCSMQEFGIHNYKGRVIGGDWDRLEKRFDELDVYVAFKQVCIEGKPWSDTAFYKRTLAEIEQGHVLWQCRNQVDLDRRCQDLEYLFQAIGKHGYKSQQELLQANPSLDRNQGGEVTVNIGRHGDLLFSDGAHRLTAAKLLGVRHIPIEVAVRHPEWIRFRHEILLYAKELDGKIYQPALHPDLIDIPAHHSCEDRFIMIYEHLQAKHGRLLDIGANWGYFCHRFEDAGFECYAVEDFPKEYYFLDKLKRAANKNFKTLNESVLESETVRNTHFDVVLALNIFHHFIKTASTFEAFTNLLHNLQVDELIFEPHRRDEPQMQGAYLNFLPDEFVEFLLQNTCLRQAESIHSASDGRTIYRLFDSVAERAHGN